MRPMYHRRPRDVTAPTAGTVNSTHRLTLDRPRPNGERPVARARPARGKWPVARGQEAGGKEDGGERGAGNEEWG